MTPHFPSFNEAMHYGRGRYEIDWSTNEERKFKEPVRCVQIYENGRVEVNSNGYRDPYWRGVVRKAFGLDFVFVKELADVLLYDSETGAKVSKSQLSDSLFLRYKNRLYTVGGNAKITFLHPDAQPVATGKTRYAARNKRRETEMLGALKEHIALGVTLNQVSKNEHYYYSGLSYATTSKLVTGRVPTDLTTEEAQHFCRAIAKNLSRTYAAVTEAAKDQYTAQYFIIKEKQ